MKKSKAIFMLLAVFAVCMLVLFSYALAVINYILMAIAIVLFIATFGFGFTLKKKYRENGWL